MARMVIIENREGAQYAVLPADFEKGADGEYRGFRVLSYEDGGRYEGPKTASAVAKAQDAPARPEKAAGPQQDGE